MGAKKIAGVLVVLAAMAGGGYFLGLPAYESAQAKKIAAAIAAMPGAFTAEDVTYGYFDKKVTIRGLKGKPTFFSGQLYYEVDLAEVEISGVNLDAGVKPGVTPLADTVIIRNGRLGSFSSGQQFSPEYSSTGTWKELTLKKVTGDLDSFRHIGEAPALSSEPSMEEQAAAYNAAASVLTAMDSVKAAGFEASDCRIEISSPLKFEAVIASMTASDISMMKCGPSRSDDITMLFMDKEIARIGQIRSEFSEILNFMTIPMNSEEPEVYFIKLEAFLTENPLVIKGLVIDTVSFAASAAEPLTIESLTMDLALGLGKTSWVSGLKQLTIPVAAYSMLGQEGAALAKTYGKPLVFDGMLDIRATQENGNGEVTVADLQITESSLARIEANSEMAFQAKGPGLAGLIALGADVFFKKGRLCH